jgi:hypothetical protein
MDQEEQYRISSASHYWLAYVGIEIESSSPMRHTSMCNGFSTRHLNALMNAAPSAPSTAR